jgi:hypothetical protein
MEILARCVRAGWLAVLAVSGSLIASTAYADYQLICKVQAGSQASRTVNVVGATDFASACSIIRTNPQYAQFAECADGAGRLGICAGAAVPYQRHVFYFSGAGHDGEGSGYIQQFEAAFRRVPGTMFTDVVVSKRGPLAHGEDVSHALHLYNGPDLRAEAPVRAGLPQTRVALPQGVKRILFGYSFGANVAASVAYQLANEGVRIDHLALLAAPLSMEFIGKLQHHPNIGRVHLLVIAGDIVRPGIPIQALMHVMASDLSKPLNPNFPHFYFAIGGPTGQARIDNELIPWLRQQKVFE